jgi:hypothetical protein
MGFCRCHVVSVSSGAAFYNPTRCVQTAV